MQAETEAGSIKGEETIAYLAVSKDWPYDFLEIAETGDVVSSKNYKIKFDKKEGRVSAPLFWSQMQSFDGPQTATMRLQRKGLTKDTAKVFIEEETTNGNKWHTTENVGYIAVWLP